MPENNPLPKKNFSLDWLVRGILTKIGDTFDRLTGRSWKPSSSLATSELIERLKKLIDSEVEDLGEKGKFVPHNIKLKMQWDKFSTDADNSLKALETELLIAAIDHINDGLYHTHAPIKLEVKQDYFTEGIKLLVSFDKFAEEEREVELRVTIPDMKAADLMPQEAAKPSAETFIARYALNQALKETKITFSEKRRLSVGRSKENDLTLEDSSISKIHAALVLNNENQLLVADTGSTNGTFVNDVRIAYGKAFPVETGAKIRFGSIEVAFEYVPKPTEVLSEEELPQSDSVQINGFEFRSKSQVSIASEIENETVAPANATDEMVLQPIEKPDNLSESFNPKRGVATDFDEKSDSPK